MPTARKLPSGNWRVRVYIGMDNNGKKQYKSITASTKKEAERLASNCSKLDPVDSNITLRQALNNYIDSNSNIYSPATIAAYRSIVRNHFTELGNIKISAITQQKLQKLINNESANLSPKTIKNIVYLLKPALKMYGYDFNFSIPPKEKKDIYIPTKEEVKTLLANSTGDLHTAILLASYMGMRRGEICALEKKDINLKNKTITINKSIVLDENNQYHIKAPKTYTSNRVLPMPDAVYQHFKKGNGPITITPKALTGQFTRLVNKTMPNHFRFHDLRHFYASVMLLLNVPDKYAAEQMGHSSTAMLKNVYQHTVENNKNVFADMVNDFLS